MSGNLATYETFGKALCAVLGDGKNGCHGVFVSALSNCWVLNTTHLHVLNRDIVAIVGRWFSPPCHYALFHCVYLHSPISWTPFCTVCNMERRVGSISDIFVVFLLFSPFPLNANQEKKKENSKKFILKIAYCKHCNEIACQNGAQSAKMIKWQIRISWNRRNYTNWHCNHTWTLLRLLRLLRLLHLLHKWHKHTKLFWFY